MDTLGQYSASEDVTISQLDIILTQELQNLNVLTNDRFKTVSVVTVEELEKRKLERVPKNTRRQNCWAVSAYEEWASWRNTQADTLMGDAGLVPVDLAKESVLTLDYWLSRFILECRRKDGKPYPPATLYNISSALQRHLREVCGRVDVNMLDPKDHSFAEFRKQLDSRMKELTNEGIGIHVQRADPVTEEDENMLWVKGSIGHSSGRSLSYGVFFYNCKVFGFRGGDEHRNLDVNQYAITHESGRKVLTFMGRNSKNVQGGLNQRKVEPKLIKQFEMPSNSRCVVKLFETYLLNIPDAGPFYRRPLPNKSNGMIHFSSQTIGANTLCVYMKTMFMDAGIETTGRNIRNHSGKVTLCSRMYEGEFDEQAIMARSGHRSTAVRTYKRPSDELLQRVSDTLQPPGAVPTTCTKKVKLETQKSANSEDSASQQESLNSSSIEISVPESITTVIINKSGRKISINL